MFSSIVVGTNGTSRSRAAVGAAAALAKAHGADLHLVWAYKPALQMAGGLPGADAMAMATAPSDAEVHASVTSDLERLAGELSGDGVAAKVHAVPQSAAAAILAVAKEQGADLVIVGNKGMKGARRVLGSVPNTVAHEASCAVMIVPTS